jgi:hypothetical protein
VLSAFKALPLDLVDGPGKWAEKNERWNPYKVFQENYGSHILVQTQYGSRFQIWVSTQSTSSNIQSVLKAKACLDIEGSGPAGSGAVKGCSSVTEEQRKEAKSLSANIKKVIRGGTFATRAALTNETSSKNMEDFINSSENSDQAVNWRYKPIWGLLQSTYQTECQNSVAGSDACKNYQRALNLEAAYAGYLAWDCTYSNARTSLGLGGMTSTSADSKSVYTWSCSQSRVGCHNNDDCHVGGAGSVSYCYGSSCFDGEEVAGAPGKYKTVIRRSQTGSYSEGVNESCYMGFASSYCNTSWAGGLPDRHLWDQSGSAALSAALVDTDQGHERKMFDLEVSIESGKNPDVSPSTQFPDEPSMASNALDGDIFPYRVRSIPAGIDCPTLCKATFPQDTNITLYWTSLDKRYKIKSWYGDVCKNKIGLVKSNKLLSELSISPSEYKQVALCKFTLDEDVSVDLNLRKPSSRE